MGCPIQDVLNPRKKRRSAAQKAQTLLLPSPSAPPNQRATVAELRRAITALYERKDFEDILAEYVPSLWCN